MCDFVCQYVRVFGVLSLSCRVKILSIAFLFVNCAPPDKLPGKHVLGQ